MWAVIALDDECITFDTNTNTCTEYDDNKIEVVHTYDDTWFLTGFSVREDHGTDTALVYEDPNVDNDLNNDNVLTLLTYGLDHSFMAGRDCDTLDGNGVCVGNGQRDITVPEMYRRFNHFTNGGVTAEERWNITNTLAVRTFSYAHIDEALAHITMTDTKAILNNAFTPYWTQSSPISPTILFAREERYRDLNLDDNLLSPGVMIQWTGNKLTADLRPDRAPLETLAGMSWAPYRRVNNAWESYPIDEYWNELQRRYAPEFSGEPDPDVGAGQVIVGQLFYLLLFRGEIAVVQANDLIYKQDSQTHDRPIGATIVGVVGAAIKFVINVWVLPG